MHSDLQLLFGLRSLEVTRFCAGRRLLTLEAVSNDTRRRKDGVDKTADACQHHGAGLENGRVALVDSRHIASIVQKKPLQSCKQSSVFSMCSGILACKPGDCALRVEQDKMAYGPLTKIMHLWTVHQFGCQSC